MREDRNSPSDVFARRLIVNVLAGVVVTYGVTVAICLPALPAATAAGVAALPGVFAGPFVGGLVTMVMAMRRAETAEADGVAAGHAPVAVAPA